MAMLADQVDAVIGVDTHKHTHTAAVVTPTGGLVAHVTVPTDAFGAKRVLAFARGHAPGRRVWAIEGTGGYGAGLTTFLLEQGEWVVEIDRPAGRLAATGPSPMSSMRSGPPARRFRASTSRSRAGGATARRSGPRRHPRGGRAHRTRAVSGSRGSSSMRPRGSAPVPAPHD